MGTGCGWSLLWLSLSKDLSEKTSDKLQIFTTWIFYMFSVILILPFKIYFRET
jgi:hypothetical protein